MNYIPAEITVSTVTALIITGASVLVALGVWWRKMLPVWRGIRAVHEIIQRELTPNGGSSMKDATVAASRNAVTATQQLQQLMGTQAAMMAVIDNMNRRNHGEHEEMWEALHNLGYDRRHAS